MFTTLVVFGNTATLSGTSTTIGAFVLASGTISTFCEAEKSRAKLYAYPAPASQHRCVAVTCGRCNLALGIIESSGGLMVHKFLEYLESHNAGKQQQ